MRKFRPSHCPKCGAFLQGDLVDKLARKPNGDKIYIKLYAECCEKCDYRRLENYQAHIESLGLCPW